MPMVTLRVSDDEKEAWVEQAGGARKLSEWIRARCNGTLAERGNERDGHSLKPLVCQSDDVTGVTVETRPGGASSPPRSASVPERTFRPDFKKPRAETKPRRR